MNLSKTSYFPRAKVRHEPSAASAKICSDVLFEDEQVAGSVEPKERQGYAGQEDQFGLQAVIPNPCALIREARARALS